MAVYIYPHYKSKTCFGPSRFVSFMHWLHVYPNSDSSTFRHFFGKFLEESWQILCSYLADILPENTTKPGFGYFALGRLSAFSWQSFGTYLERKKCLANFWIQFLVFLLNFGTNFVGKLDKNQPKKCRKVEKSDFLEIGFSCSQCIRLIHVFPNPLRL